MKNLLKYFQDIGNSFISFIKIAGALATAFAVIIGFLRIFFDLNMAIKYSIYVGILILIIAVIKQQLTINFVRDCYHSIKTKLARLRIFKRLKHLEYENYYLMSNLRRIKNFDELNKFLNDKEAQDLLSYYHRMGSFEVSREELINKKQR